MQDRWMDGKISDGRTEKFLTEGRTNFGWTDRWTEQFWMDGRTSDAHGQTQKYQTAEWKKLLKYRQWQKLIGNFVRRCYAYEFRRTDLRVRIFVVVFAYYFYNCFNNFVRVNSYNYNFAFQNCLAPKKITTIEPLP